MKQISRGKLAYYAKIVAIWELFKYNQSRLKEVLEHYEKDDNSYKELDSLINLMIPIIQQIKEFLRVSTKGMSDDDFKTLHSKAQRYNSILSNNLGYIGSGLNIKMLLNNNRNVRHFDLDIIGLKLLNRIKQDDLSFKEDLELLVIKVAKATKYSMRDRLEHIGRVNHLEMLFK